ncbi:HIT domain-containing protein [Ditylenchus destructor]|uniref:HIT domain-containing protein n=1 Tax=Ditylenchus destructor TaxID=166010 RepID=A0AAD4R8T6_9BILA|nr:HIT domain-containing protein [Ditylenchus destructor]
MTSEAVKAQGADPQDTIFGKIIKKEIPAKIIYEDDSVIAFHDICPQAPVHFLVLPKERIDMFENITEQDSDILMKVLLTAKNIAKSLNLKDGYRIVINNGRHGCQSVKHLHVHVFGGRQMGWPPGTSFSVFQALWYYICLCRNLMIFKVTSWMGFKQD